MSDSREFSGSEDSEPEYEVERIVAERLRDGRTMYLVKWLHYGDNQCTWEPADNFMSPYTIADWKRQLALGDSLDDEEIARVQARMDEFQAAAARKESPPPRSPTPDREVGRFRPASLVMSPPLKRRAKSQQHAKSKRPALPGMTRQDESALPPALKPPSTLLKEVGDQPGVALQAQKSMQSRQNQAGEKRSTKDPRGPNTASTARKLQDKAGQRFKNLKHQNNVAKLARREPAPDMSKLDLKAPDEWPVREDFQQPPTAQTTSPETRTRDSPLFVPEERELPEASRDHPVKERRLSSSGTESQTTVTSASLRPEERELPKASDHPVNERRSSSSKTESRSTIKPASLQPEERELPEPSHGHPVNERKSSSSGTEPRTTLKSAPPRPEDNTIPVSTVNKTPFDPPPRTTMPVATVTARNGRSWRRGDVIVNMRFGDHPVGDVKILHLPPWLVVKLLALKEAGDTALKIHFLERNVIEWGLLPALMRNLVARPVALGSIESYEDTVRATDNLADHLESNNCGAIWQFPFPGDMLVMILYSCRAPGWRNFGMQTVTMFEPRLHLAFRNHFPNFHLDSLLSSRGVLPRTTAEADSHLSRPMPDIPGHGLRLSTTQHADAHVEKPLDRPMKIERTPSTQTPTSPPRRNSESLNSLSDPPVPTSTPVQGASFENLGTMLFGTDKTKVKPRVFISFARSFPAEANAVKDWLSKRISVRDIYTDTENHGWSDWQEIVSHTKTGIILFHDQSPVYCDLNFLGLCLKRFSNIMCYNLTFQQLENAGLVTNAVSRLFPRGTALLITESSMVNNPNEVLYAMQWFEKHSNNKVQSWTLLLLPNAVEWILRRAINAPAETQASYLGMLEVIHRLNMESLEHSLVNPRSRYDYYLSATDSSVDEDESFVLSPAELPGYPHFESSDTSADSVKKRDELLLQYFCGWAALKATKHRRFVLLDPEHTNNTFNHSWHVSIKEPAKFVEEERQLERPNLSTRISGDRVIPEQAMSSGGVPGRPVAGAT